MFKKNSLPQGILKTVPDQFLAEIGAKLTKWWPFKKINSEIKILNSETVRDRAKRTKFWDHIDSQ